MEATVFTNDREGCEMLGRWIIRHWGAICIGCVLMGLIVRIVYAERGYVALGMEWLIVPMVFAAEGWIRRRMAKSRKK